MMADTYRREVVMYTIVTMVLVIFSLNMMMHMMMIYQTGRTSAVSTSDCIITIPPREENVMEMKYYSGKRDLSFLLSLHPSEEDGVISKGIKEGLFSPLHRYPSVDEMHAVCELFTDTCVDGKVFVEVGSAIGAVSVYMASRGMRVYAYDPILPNVQRLSESRCLNQYARLCNGSLRKEEEECMPFSPSNFRVFWNAVGSAAGGSVHVESEPNNLAATARGGGSFRAEVGVVTIDETVVLAAGDRIEMMLLTCQGNEYDALLGASGFLNSGRLRNIVWRRHATRPEHDETALKIMRLLGDHGFTFFFWLKASRAAGVTPPVRMSYEEMLERVVKLSMQGVHSNVLASRGSL